MTPDAYMEMVALFQIMERTKLAEIAVLEERLRDLEATYPRYDLMLEYWDSD
jgi:hypothetical protein